MGWLLPVASNQKESKVFLSREFFLELRQIDLI